MKHTEQTILRKWISKSMQDEQGIQKVSLFLKGMSLKDYKTV